ncbi:MAG: hypothetical protein EBE86_025240 [Hormoscilla sp. GUM202]|nr:hypothetical protein [Hormoscilla sp. GM7CHS1pb]MBO1350472.1 hypothetical protein [Hormoscilla sp. GUM202]
MQQLSEAKQEIITRISPIVAKLIQSNSLFEELEQDKMIEIISEALEKHFSLAEIRAMPDDDLTDRIDGVLGIQVLYYLLSDFTPEQMAEFEAAIPKRK